MSDESITQTSVDAEPPEIAWEHDWEMALARTRRERRVLLVDVEREN